MDYALITGATSGIGYELAKIFAEKGYGLVLVSSSETNLSKTKEQIEVNVTVPIYIIKQDLTKLGAAQELYHKIEVEKIPISVLINNAGFGLVGETQEIDLLQDEAMMMINVINLVELSKLFIHKMYKRKNGIILNVSSTGAFQPGPYTSTYFASKAFVLSYTRAIRYEAKGKGIQVSTLCPGATKTKFFDREQVATPISAMSARKVAQIAYQGLIKNKEIIVPGMKNKLLQLFPLKLRMYAVANMKKA